ncbi:MAG: universal stress protein, partial [Syntrophobacteraceae bacterium]
KMPAYKYRLVSVDAWEQQQEKTIRDFMNDAKAVIMAAGFPEAAITLRTEERKVGIARDIATESRNGYKAIVVGRKGISELKDFMMGSIAQKILELASRPVWIVGGASTARKILVCLDNSDGAMRAVEHLGEMLSGVASRDILLLHVARGYGGLRKFIRDVFISEGNQSAVDELEKEFKAVSAILEPSFEKAKSLLTAGGIDSGRISRKVAQGGGNSGNTIIEEAEALGFDTIVLGRRGISRVEEFLMGRVSNKVIQLAKEMNVWVVS